jgi:hypothetical protein
MWKKKLDRRSILRYLQALGRKLKESGRKHPVRVLMLGGAYLILNGYVQRTTEDIDVLVLMPDLRIYYEQVKPMGYRHFWDVVEEVALDLGIQATWMNDRTGEFMTEFEPQGSLWQTFDYLEVWFPSIEAIFVMKLSAYREKDKGDIAGLRKKLGIRTREQAQAVIDRYCDRQYQEHYEITEHLFEEFPD